METGVPVLFARRDSVYKGLGCDVFDADRDARTWGGGRPAVFHPPCRGWGRLRHFAKPREDELALGLLAVDLCRTWGGVIEHPAQSSLWLARAMPAPGAGLDAAGGWTLPIVQRWWGHEAEKATWLYIVGCAPGDVPRMPIDMMPAAKRVEGMRKSDRERTPIDLARWLIDVAQRCRVQH